MFGFIGFAAWNALLLSLAHFKECVAVQDDSLLRSRIPTKWPQRWPGKGLTIHITNALEDKYQSFFTKAIKNWENAAQLGAPDSIRFVVSKIDSSSTYCDDGVDGGIVICNADYGQTSWVGIEITVSDGGDMLKSIVKINDHYLDKVPPAYKQYSLCHEIGHSLGLEHNDEDFYNKGTQSCMDYTANVGDSQQPNTIDYGILTQLYGKIPVPPHAVTKSPIKHAETQSPIKYPAVVHSDQPNLVVSQHMPLKKPAKIPVALTLKPVKSTEVKIPVALTGKPVKATEEPVKLTSNPVSTTAKPAEIVGKPVKLNAPSVSNSSMPQSARPLASVSPTMSDKPSVNPTSLPTMRPTPPPCCSYDNKDCGMAAYCDSNRDTCQMRCAGIWLNGKTWQQRQESNCKEFRTQCGENRECCGNSICQHDPYLGYAVCAPGPPTKSPTKQPSASPTKTMSPSSSPTEITMAPTALKPRTTMPVFSAIASPQQEQLNYEQQIIDPIHCLCPQTCTRGVLSISGYQSQSCSYLIDYQIKNFAMSELYACLIVSQTYSTCGGTSCNPYRCPGSELNHRALISDNKVGTAIPLTKTKATLQHTSSATSAATHTYKQQPRRLTLDQLNLTKIERDLGYNRELLGELIQTSSKSLRYAITNNDTGTLITEMTFHLIPEDIFSNLE